MSWVAHISVERLFSLQVFGESRGLSAKSVAILGIALILRVGFGSPLCITLFRLTLSYTLTGIICKLGCRVIGNKFSFSITACTYFIVNIGYWLFEIIFLPIFQSAVVAKGWDFSEINVMLTLIGLTWVSLVLMWNYWNLFGVLFQQGYGNTGERVAAIKALIDNIVTESRVQRMNPQRHQVIERPEEPSIYIRQNVAVYVVQALVSTIRGFKLSERQAADLRHRSDWWTQELEENNTYLSPCGLRQTQLFVSFIIQLNYIHRVNNDAASLGEGVQQEVMNWVMSVAQHPRNQLYIQQVKGVVRKYTTAATLSTIDKVFLPLPQGLEPVDNGTYIRCLFIYMVYIFAKEWTEIRMLTKYILPIFFTYRYIVNQRGLQLEDERYSVISTLTPKNLHFLFKVVAFVFLLHITHSSRMKKLLPRVAQNSLLFNFTRYGIIPLYLSLRRYINANWEVLQ
jgi:hypothetical protein